MLYLQKVARIQHICIQITLQAWSSDVHCNNMVPCMFQTAIGSSQPVVIFSRQPQQPYFSVPQVDPMTTSSVPGMSVGQTLCCYCVHCLWCTMQYFV